MISFNIDFYAVSVLRKFVCNKNQNQSLFTIYKTILEKSKFWSQVIW